MPSLKDSYGFENLKEDVSDPIKDNSELNQGKSTGEQARYWLFPVVEENWFVCRDEEIWGVPFSIRVDPRKFIKQGDYLVFYVPQKGAHSYGKMFVGVYRIVSEWFEGKEPFWPDEKREKIIKYPLRVRIKPVKIGCVSLDEIENKLRFIKGYRNIGLAFRGTPANNGRPLPLEDGKLIMRSLKRCPEESGISEKNPNECVHEDISYEDVRRRVLERLFIDEDIVILVNSLLDAGENVLFYGPPGIGKTMLAKEVTVARGYEPYYAVATAHWSRYDVIGGVMLEGNEAKWHSGFLVKAIVKHVSNFIRYRECRSNTKGVYLIIDEVNRADVDKAFGEFFLIFSNHNLHERIIPVELIEEIRSYINKNAADEYAHKLIEYLEKYLEKVEINGTLIGYKVPLGFRIIATMNQADVRNLFTIGDAFARRFATVEFSLPSEPEHLLNKLYKNLKLDIISNIGVADDVIEDVRKLIDDKLIKLYNEAKKRAEERVANELRVTNINMIISPSSLYRAIKAFTILYLKEKERILKEPNRSLRKCIEVSLPLSRLWDRRAKQELDKVLENVFRKAST